jgi:hypothetical protein
LVSSHLVLNNWHGLDWSTELGGTIGVVTNHGVVQVYLGLLWGFNIRVAAFGGPAALFWLKLSTFVFIRLNGIVELLHEVEMSNVDEEKSNLEWAAVMSALVEIFGIEIFFISHVFDRDFIAYKDT